jgi:CheY-like chemotaxis protein
MATPWRAIVTALASRSASGTPLHARHVVAIVPFAISLFSVRARGETRVESHRIVVVNDSPEFLETVREILADAGYEVTAHHGDDLTADAIAALRPDLVIVDLVLRRRSLRDQLAAGWDLLVLIRAHAQLTSVPIIVCSADTRQLRQREGELQQVAATYVLPKPFSIDQLEAVVRSALEDRQAEAS